MKVGAGVPRVLSRGQKYRGVRQEWPAIRLKSTALRLNPLAVGMNPSEFRPEESSLRLLNGCVRQKFSPIRQEKSSVRQPDAPKLQPDGLKLLPDGPILQPDARLLQPDAPVLLPDGPELVPDVPTIVPDARFLVSDARFLLPDAPDLVPDGLFFLPDRPLQEPDRSLFLPEASLIQPDATLLRVPRCFQGNWSWLVRLPAPEGPVRVAGGQARPKGEPHPPVSRPTGPRPGGAHERFFGWAMVHAPRRGAGHSGPAPVGALRRRSFPPATFTRASGAALPGPWSQCAAFGPWRLSTGRPCLPSFNSQLSTFNPQLPTRPHARRL